MTGIGTGMDAIGSFRYQNELAKCLVRSFGEPEEWPRLLDAAEQTLLAINHFLSEEQFSQVLDCVSRAPRRVDVPDDPWPLFQLDRSQAYQSLGRRPAQELRLAIRLLEMLEGFLEADYPAFLRAAVQALPEPAASLA